MNWILNAIFIGAGATLLMDIWALIREQLFGIPRVNYALVWRWIAYMPSKGFFQNKINAAPPCPYEQLLGWLIHYLIGILFAMIFLVIYGIQWINNPSFISALFFGVVTVMAPFLLMQPGMGAGIAASRLPEPNMVRINSLITHAIFGTGLYLAALIWNWLF